MSASLQFRPCLYPALPVQATAVSGILHTRVLEQQVGACEWIPNLLCPAYPLCAPYTSLIQPEQAQGGIVTVQIANPQAVIVG